MTKLELPGAQQRAHQRRNILLLFISLLLSLVLAESLLRLAGKKPWQVTTLSLSVEPAGKSYAVDSLLGYHHVAGQFKISHPTGYTWTTTHGADGLRITEPFSPAGQTDARPEVWIFGCSYTHGWSLNDDETYPWLLQQMHPQLHIVNFGVGGYGTVNSLLQFERASQMRPRLPILVVVAYAGFHDQRNVPLRKRYKRVVSWSRKLGARWRPYAWLGDDKLRIDISQVEYREFPLMRVSALMHSVEKAYNRVEAYFDNSNEVTRALLRRFSRLAADKRIPFLVAGIDSGAAHMLHYLDDRGIQTIDIAIDLKDSAFRNVPHDDHPNAAANQIYATRLARRITAMHLPIPQR